MINFERYFSLIFKSGKPVSNINLKRFTVRHLSALVHYNVGGKYDTLISLTGNAYNNFFGNVEDKRLAKSISKSKTKVNDFALEQIVASVDKHYNLIIYKFPQSGAEYLEFFPNGKTEYTEMNKATAPLLMDSLIKACTKYVAEITQPVVDEFTANLDLFNNTRDVQLGYLDESDLESTEISQTRAVLEFQLNKNLLILATEYLGDVQRGMDFFDQQYLGITGTSGGDTPPVPPPPTAEIVAAIKMNMLKPISMIFRGTTGRTLTIKPGDSSAEELILHDAVSQAYTYNYAAPGNYVARISGYVFDIIEFSMVDSNVSAFNIPEGVNCRKFDFNNNLCTSIFIPESCTSLINFQMNDNELDQQSVNALLIRIESFGTSNGTISIVGGSNAAPSGLGIAAKNALIARGWTVLTN